MRFLLPKLMLVLWLFSGTQSMALEVYVQDAQGTGLSNAVVALHGREPLLAPADTYRVIDQVGREFLPSVAAVQAGSWIRFPNSDDIRHHVYSFSPAKRFELKLYHGATAEPVKFDTPGQVVLGCNIHDSMVGYVYVVATPYYALTDSRGRVNIEAPAGNYQLEVQHPRSAQGVTQAVEVNQAAAELKVTLAPLAPDPRNSQPKTDLEKLFDR
ncbi:methylamine utilization protein [Gilvimarinus agarilyticus]|uniref:methylamine utilization protein n=1 Tax=Gilvimarinus agarilyticus TaxID=679259 RepID=UPI00069909EF|nr:methylamine utilization protein [Gilvimarinus agarilyticus]